MKNLISILWVLAAALTVTGLSGCTKSEPLTEPPTATAKYTCSMHPEVVQDTPGNCPKCGMKLVKKP